MQTTEEYRAFWRRLADLYHKALAKETSQWKRDDWLKRIAEAEERAGITSPNQ